VLKTGARAAIITFHSIEDRLVKVYFRDNAFDLPEENPFTMSEREVTLKLVNKKPIVASQQELKKNPRARSAKLRVAERV
jgi:16S rRNA (cytosine1402-N4)-methyltransferase